MKPRHFRCHRSILQNRRCGAILPLIALLLPVLIVIVGFSVDLAFMQSVRTEMRVVADLSAKAAAAELSRTQSVGQARVAARDVASNNLVAGKAVTLDNADIVFGRSTLQSGSWVFQAGGTPNNSIQVNVRRTSSASDGPVRLFFGRFYGRRTFQPTIAATATFQDVDICLVLDRSSSMKLATNDTAGFMDPSDPRFCAAPYADSRWVAVENAVGLFTTQLSTTLAVEHTALVTFASDYTSSCGETNSEASTDQDLDGDLTLIDQAMADRSNTVWNGATNIHAGINQARSVLTGTQSRSNAEKVMIVLTDGVYTGDDPSTEATLAAADGILIHTITYGDGANQTDMQAVAQNGNGQHYHAPDETTLNDIFTEIAATFSILTQ